MMRAGDHVYTDPRPAYSIARLRVAVSRPPLVMDASTERNFGARIVHQRSHDLHHMAAALLQHHPDRVLNDEEETVEVLRSF
jgi:hypothetical protein